MVHDFLTGRDAVEVERERVFKPLSEFPVFAYDKRQLENPRGFVVDTLPAVFQSFFAT